MPAKKGTKKTVQGRCYIGKENGVDQWFWVGRFATARERDRAVARAYDEKPWLKVAKPGELTCDQWADRWLKRMEDGKIRTRNGRHFKRSTIDTYRSGLRAFRQAFGSRGPGSISRIEAEDFADSTTPGQLPSVVQLMNYIVSTDDGETVGRNRFAGLSPRKVTADRTPPAETDMLTYSEACSALGAHGPMFRALFIFAAYTLMRPGELFALTWENIDLAAGRIRVELRLYRGGHDLPKSNKARTIALPGPARRALEDLQAIPGYYPAGLVFRNKRGNQMTAPILSLYWSQVKARARLDHEFYVATKHFGVWYMKVKKGLPDAVIAAQAGWSEAAVTAMVKTYGHAVDDRRLTEIDDAFADLEVGAEAKVD